MTTSVLLISGLATAPAQAALTQALTRADLGANDLINWGTLGANGNLLNNPFAATSTGGLGVTVSKDAATSFQLLVQSAPSGWSGNFTPGETILWTNDYPGAFFNAITLVFASPVSGVGANIQQANYLASNTGLIEAYDSSNTLIGSFTASGASNQNADGSAVFLGLKSTEANISRVRFYLTAAPFNYFASFGINQVSLVTPAAPPNPNPSAVPEPTTVVTAALGGLALLGRALAARRRKPPALEPPDEASPRN